MNRGMCVLHVLSVKEEKIPVTIEIELLVSEEKVDLVVQVPKLSN